MKIIFHGATHTVTGSLHEVQAAGKRLILDCGFFQGPRDVARKLNSSFDFPVDQVDALFLSHGHTDHCAKIPLLVKQGYSGPIYATRATAALSALMLLDSAKIQEEDTAYLNQKTTRSWQGKIEPLYTQEDVEKTIRLFKPLEYRKPLDLGGVTVEFRDAGHVLGSAAIALTETTTGRTLVFSGDVGRPNSPVLRDPDPFTNAHVFISECTYGGKTHAPVQEVPGLLARIIRETADRGGWLLIPAFALGRTQTLVHQIHQLHDDQQIPGWLPVYVDSPLANRLTEVFRQFPNLWDAETKDMLQPFDFPNLAYTASPDESRALNQRPGPGIIIASSGMCEGGRILHHLKHHIRDPKTTVLLAGYQAEHTLGRKMADRWREVPILGDVIPLNARIEQIDGLSAHADGPELLQYTAPLKGNAKANGTRAPGAATPHIYLVHGEPPAATAHQAALIQAGFPNITIPTQGDTAEV